MVVVGRVGFTWFVLPSTTLDIFTPISVIVQVKVLTANSDGRFGTGHWVQVLATESIRNRTNIDLIVCPRDQEVVVRATVSIGAGNSIFSREGE